MRRFVRWVLLAPLLLAPLLLAGEAAAADPNDPVDPNAALPPVSLSAPQPTQGFPTGEVIEPRETVSGVEAIGTVRVVTDADIDAMGARTLDEALGLLPGLNVRTGGQGEPRLDLRGFRPRHTLLLLNGVPLNSTFDGQFDPSFIPVENIARIKTTFGNSSLLYGDGPLAGVINIVTKQPEDGVHGRVGVEADPGDQALGVFELSAARSQTHLYASGSGYNANDFELSHDFSDTTLQRDSERLNSDSQRRNLFASVSHALRDDLLLGGVVSGVNGEFGRPPTSADQATDPYANRARYERVESLRGMSGHVSADWDPSSPLRVRGWAWHNDLRQDQEGYDDARFATISDPRSNTTFLIDDETRTNGAALHTSWDLALNHVVTLGLLGRRDDYQAEGVIRDVRLGGGRFGLRNVDDDFATRSYTATLEWSGRPVRGVELVGGYSYSGFDADLASRDRASSFLAGASWQVSDDTRLRGSFSRRLRFPSIRQLYDSARGNLELAAETSRSFEAGVEQQLGKRSRLSVTGFFTLVNDLIERDALTDRFENVEEDRLRGIEVDFETRLRPQLLLRAGYGLLVAEDRSSGASEDVLPNRPRHRFTLESRYRFGFGTMLQTSLVRVTDSTVYTRNAPLLDQTLSDYTLVGCKLSHELLEGRLNMYVAAENLLDESYEEEYGFPEPGRVFRFGSELRF